MTGFPIVAVALATVLAFMVGGVWYSPLFGKVWQAEQNFTEADKARSSMVKLLAISLLCEAVMAVAFALLLRHIPHTGRITMTLAGGIALGFVVPTLVMNHSYAMKSIRLMAIDAGHWLLVFLAIGLVFALLHV